MPFLVTDQHLGQIQVHNQNQVAERKNKNALEPFLDKDYRDSYLDGYVKGSIPAQIRALREKYGLTQAEFAEKTGMTQSVISRLENTEYGAVTVNTLLKVAKENDVALEIKFTDYLSVLERDLGPPAIKVENVFETYERYELGDSTTLPASNFVNATAAIVFIAFGAHALPISSAENVADTGVLTWQNPPRFLLEPSSAINSPDFGTPNTGRSTQTPAPQV